MRILMIEGSGRGFLAQYSRALALGLHQAGDRVHLLTKSCDELADWPLPYERQASLTGGLIDWFIMLREVRRIRPDLVHFHWIGAPRIAARFCHWLKRQGIAVCYTPQNILPHQQRSQCISPYLRLYQSLSGVFTRDAHMDWALRELFDLADRKVTCIPHGPQLTAHGEVYHDCLKLEDDEPLRLLFFGHGARNKGLSDLLQALLMLPHNIKLDVVLAGEQVTRGTSPDLLREVQKRYPLDIIPNYLSAATAARLFRSCHLLALPYRKLCKTPLVELANDLGLPVLRSSQVEATGFDEGRSGWTLPSGSVEEWAGWLVDNLRDRRVLQASYASLGPTLAQSRLSDCVSAHQRFYRQILETTARVVEQTQDGEEASTELQAGEG